MRSIALATIWFGLAIALTGAVADGLETWGTRNHAPYAEWAPPGAQAPSLAETPATSPADPTSTRSRTPRAER